MLNKHGLIAAFAMVFTAVSLFFAGTAFAYTAKDLKTGDRYYQEKSYRLSATAFERLLSEKTENKSLAREVLFKYSDSILRGKDEAKREQAEKNLKELADSKDKDRWRAEAGGALAEHYFERDRWGHAQEIQTMLEDAREYWAGSDDVKLAREKFIALSFLLADHVTSWRGWYNPQIRAVSISGGKIKAPDGGSTMTQLYEEILKVAKADEDKARAYYGLALSMRYSGNSNDKDGIKKTVKAFEKVTEDFPRSEWADDAWSQLGQFHEGANRFPEAVKAYKGLLETFKRGESQFVDDARRRIEYITNPSLSMSVSNSFTPGSQIRFNINWRNMDQARFTLYKLDMVAELKQRAANASDMTNYQGLLRQLVERSQRYRFLPVEADWMVKLKNDGKHMHHSSNQGMAAWRSKNPEKPDEKLGVLPAGAYLLMVTGANGQKAYDLVLVSDLALVSKLSRDTALFMVADAKTGKPAPNALVRYVYSWVNTNGGTQWEVAQGKTGADGLLAAELKYTRDQQPYYHNHNMFAAVFAAGGLQAFVQNNYYNNYNNNKGEWWTYAFTDRPAYRPNEQVGFKGVVRIPENGIFINPAGMQIRALIYDARGNKVYEKEHVLNEFGGFNDTLELDDKAVLGEYNLQIHNVKTGSHISTSQLFRLEEYKLPEFLVSVAPKLEDGKDPVFRLGDKLEMDIDAKYYFGGAVANAEVEYLVYQQNYTHSYQPPRPYPWYYREEQGAYRGRHHYKHYSPYQDSGRLITQKKIKTDEKGKASFTIETEKDSASDLQYRIEVRVVDQSRREIRATSNIKVTKTAFFAYAEPERSLYRPGDKVTVKIKTMTANDKPFSVEGTVSVAQQSWREPVLKNGRDEVMTPGGYTAQPVLKKFVKTDEKGEAKFTFEPMANGYYAVTFTGYDNGKEVTAQAHVFVSDEKATDIGYRYGGLQIITEKDTYNVGETARAMIVSDRPDTWVLFTQESDGLFGYELLYMKGPVRLVEIPVTQHFVPNVNLHAASLDQFQLKQVTEEVIVPPEGKFLTVKITSDKEVYQPQEEGVFDVTVTDQDGKPVTGEVALGLVDSSVYYIQKDYAKDIREYFYGDKRLQAVAMQASFYQRSFVHLVHDAKNKMLVDKKDQYRGKDARLDAVGQIGGMADDSMRAMKKSAPMESNMARQEMAAPSAMAKGLSMADEESKEMDGAGRRANEKAAGGKGGMDADGGAEERVRDDFRSTVIWLPGVKTDRNGRARIQAKFPDSLTTWRMTARAVTKDTSVGNVTHEVRSNKQLMVRLQAPRFFTARDKVVLSALIDNISDKPLTLTPQIKTEGLTITGLYKDGQFVKGEIGPVTVAAGGQQRVDWVAYAAEEGEAIVTVSAKSGNLSDAMRKSFPVIPHGIEKFIAQSSVLKGKGTDEAIGQRLTFTLPKERIKEATALQLTLSPSLAGNMLDALPYLAEYPYGCVEQTMSRFLPAVIVRSTMTQLGLSKTDVNNYINNVLTPRGDPQHPQRRNDATVGKLDNMVESGLARLYDFQHSNGGWGWWKESSTDRFMTAYVLWGLSLARESGVNVRADVIEKAIRYMQLELVKDEDAPDNLAWSLHALAAAGSKSKFEDKQRDRLWAMRDKLNPYTRALFAVSEQKRGDMQRAAVLGRNIVNGVMEDKENGTARWGESGIHYRWSEGGVEATAFVIKALSALDKDSKYLEPAVRWLSLNRRGGRWKNTRDTAIAVLGLAEYLKTTQELSPDYIYQVKLNGKIVKEGRVTAQNVFTFDRIVNLPANVLKDGDNNVEIAIKGNGALYTSGYLTYFTLEEPITKAGNEIFVDRQYEIKSVKETLMKGLKEDWKPLNDNDTVESGDRIRVSITMEAKNHYEYLISEDFKPAGLEAVALTSGAGSAVKLDAEGRETGATVPLYQEFRDQKAVFFIDKLKQGKYIIRYELRAEVPGQFHAMPNQSHAMYVPEIRANSDEMRITVKD